MENTLIEAFFRQFDDFQTVDRQPLAEPDETYLNPLQLTVGFAIIILNSYAHTLKVNFILSHNFVDFMDFTVSLFTCISCFPVFPVFTGSDCFIHQAAKKQK